MSGRVIVARTFERELRLRCPDAAMGDALAFAAADPDMDGTVLAPLEISVDALGGGQYRVAHEGHTHQGTAGHMVEVLHRIALRLVIAEAGRHALVHGGSLVTGGRRIMVCAQKGCGKTTLMLKALEQGIAVEGDEHVMVRAGDVMARPRTLRVKGGSVPLVPGLASVILASPAIEDWNGDPIYSVAPRTGTVDWRIRPGTVDHVVFLEPNHGGLTDAAALDTNAAFETLLENVYLPARGRGFALACLRTALGRAACWKLRIGDLDRALWHLHRLAESG